MLIAIDFDGTCVTHAAPEIGKDIGAIPVLKELVYEGHQLILWTVRSHKMKGYKDYMDVDHLQKAIQWFHDHEIRLSKINEGHDQAKWYDGPKVYADLYIDDSALGAPLKYDLRLSPYAFVDWAIVRKILVKEGYLPK